MKKKDTARKKPISKEMKAMADRLYDLVDTKKKDGMNHKEIAEVIGIADGTLSRYMEPDQEASALNLGKIADYFDVSVDWLLGRSNVKKYDADLTSAANYLNLPEDTARHLSSLLSKYSYDHVQIALGSKHFITLISQFLLWEDASIAARAMTILLDENNSIPQYRNACANLVNSNRYSETVNGAIEAQLKLEQIWEPENPDFLIKAMRFPELEVNVGVFLEQNIKKQLDTLLEHISRESDKLTDKEWENGQHP